VYAAVKKHLNILPALMKCKIYTERVSNKMSSQLLKVSTIGTQLFGDVPVKQILYSAYVQHVLSFVVSQVHSKYSNIFLT